MADTPEEAARQLEGIGAELQGAIDDAALLEAGHFATALVLLRTKQGLDVDGKPFAPYDPAYAAERQQAGLRTSPPDLARTGAMLGTITPLLTGDGGVEVGPHLSEREAIKMAAHDRGVDRQVSVRPHRFASYTVGNRFTSEARAMRDGGNAYGGMTRAYSRHMRLPKREVLDIRRDDELQALAEQVVGVVVTKLERR